jgi:hypothetical protein
MKDILRFKSKVISTIKDVCLLENKLRFNDKTKLREEWNPQNKQKIAEQQESIFFETSNNPKEKRMSCSQTSYNHQMRIHHSSFHFDVEIDNFHELRIHENYEGICFYLFFVQISPFEPIKSQCVKEPDLYSLFKNNIINNNINNDNNNSKSK